MIDPKSNEPRPDASFQEEFLAFWKSIPLKPLFGTLLGGWVLLFAFLGNSTLGYVNTPSLFGWLEWMYDMSDDDSHGRLIPFIVLALVWWKRKELMEVSKRVWWPALLLFILSIALHVLGYSIQQTQVSLVAFFVGIYALTGLVWGPSWMAATFFPFFLFAFAVPIRNVAEPFTFPLRLIATHITTFISQIILGINVIQDGTRLYDALGSYQYEVAAACSGIRSLTATLVITSVYGFMMLRAPWRRLLVVAAAVPFAVIGNVMRLSMIIIAAESFGQSAGDKVHENSILSLIPYIPAVVGVMLLGHWLREDRKGRKETSADAAVLSVSEQKL